MTLQSGKKEGTSTVEWGEFYCPTCATQRQYVRKQVWRTTGASMGRIDTLIMAGEYLECAVCNETFEPDVLSKYPERDSRPFAAIYRSVMLKVMVVMMETDGRIFQEEIERICDIYEEMVGYRLPDRMLEDEINAARSTERDVFDLVEAHAGRLNDSGREKVLRAAFHVADADGSIVHKEQDFFMSLGVALGMTLKEIDTVRDAVKREGSTDFRTRT